MGVDRVVEERPSDAAEPEEDGWRLHPPGVGGVGEERAPGEGHAENGLRPPRHALGERVKGDGHEAQDSQADGDGRQRQEDEEGQARLRGEPGQGRGPQFTIIVVRHQGLIARRPISGELEVVALEHLVEDHLAVGKL